MDGWGDCSSRILVVVLEERLGIIDGFISSSKKMFFGCRYVNKIIGSSILDILSDILQLEVHCSRFIGYIFGDKGKGRIDIVEDSTEN